MKVLFWGSPDFAVPSLRALDDEGFDIVGVVTQPDRPAGRGRSLRASAVKEVALAEGYTVLTPDRPRGDAFMSEIAALAPDISVVVAYGHILRPEVLELPPMGSINVHASLLPKLRGAAPINWAIARGHTETGVTIMRMVEAMDAGAIIYTAVEPILEEETASELTLRLSEVGAAALVQALTLLSLGQVEEVEQDHDEATYAPKVDRETARIDWSLDPERVAWHVRGMDAVPGAWATLDEEPVKLFRPRGVDGPDADVPPGTVLEATAESGVVVRCGSGAIAFDEVQPPGKRRMAAADWIRGRGVEVGRRFG